MDRDGSAGKICERPFSNRGGNSDLTTMSWRRYADWAKERPLTLVLADFLGRGRGRMRMLDSLHPPRKPKLTPDLRNWEKHDLAAVWIGHATGLLRIGGRRTITHPAGAGRV